MGAVERAKKQSRTVMYQCPICGLRVESVGSAMLWCQCFPKTPTRMDDVALARTIRAVAAGLTAELRRRGR